MSIDYESYLTEIPDGKKFLRFDDYPADIVYEFLIKDLGFYLAEDA